nr:hypothetical protein [Tanacetum cinerariifolium]
MRLDAYETSISYKERTKRWHDKRIKTLTNYKKGDKVLLFNSRLRLFPGKLKSRWYGPFSVCKDMKNGAIESYDEDGNGFIINKQRVKPYQKSVLDTNKDDDITLDDEGEVTDYQSCFDEDFPKEIFSNPLFEEEIISTKIDPHHFDAESDLIESMLNCDSSIISSSSKINSFLDEFAGELTLLKSILPGIDKTDCYSEEDIRIIERLLYDNSSPRPPDEFVSENSDADIESFSPSPIPDEDSDSRMEEIDLSFNLDDLVPLSIEDDDDDSKRDFLIREELLDNYSLSLPIIESFYIDIPSFSRPPAKPPDDCGPIESRVKHLLGGVVRALMSPGGSIVASLKHVNGFLAVNTPHDDLIRINF